MTLTRRSALGFTILLVGCGARTIARTSTLGDVIDDGRLVDRAFIKAMPLIAQRYPALLSNANVSLSNITNGSTGWLDLAGALLELAAQPSQTPPNQSVLRQAMGYFDLTMNVVVPITTAVDPAIGATIGAIAVLLAVMDQTLSPPQAGVPQPTATRARAIAPRVTPEGARARLIAFLLP